MGSFGSPSIRKGSNDLPRPACVLSGRHGRRGAAGWATTQGIVTAEGMGASGRVGSRRRRREVRPVSGRRAVGVVIDLRRRVSGQYPVGRGEMRRVVVLERAGERRQAVGLPRASRKMLADPDARRGGRDRGERAADVLGRVGLGVPGVKMAFRTAPLEDQDVQGPRLGRTSPAPTSELSGRRRGLLDRTRSAPARPA